MNIIDLHCDTVLYCFANKKNLHTYDGHINLEKLKAGGSLAQCFAFFIPPREFMEKNLGHVYEPWDLYKQLLGYYRDILADASDTLRPAYSGSQIIENSNNGFISAILTIEDAVELDGKIERVDEVYEDGVRMIALTWNFENSVGFPNSRDPEKHLKCGLKPFGFEVVERMNELGIIVDVSHLSEAGFYDVAKHSKKPFAASHSCCRALKDHQRNLTDDQLKVIGDTGSVVGINFHDQFLNERNGYSTVDDVVSHILHIRDHAGIDSLAFGSDFDGIPSTLEFGDYSGLPLILNALEKHFTGDEINKLCHENALRLFSQT
ncbi:MAG: dipeptidase [Oscillospiraceae bacterium]|nr:dipeptidase [Oscillospiraceae bacterium]